MSLLQENIVYLWLLPVVAQIVLPLSILVVWSIKQVLNIQFRKSTVSKSIVENKVSDYRCLINDFSRFQQMDHIRGVVFAPPLRTSRGADFRSERFPQFAEEKYQKIAAENLKQRKVQTLIGIGGNGTFVTRNLDLSSLAGSVVYVAFRHHNSTNQYNINIDEVSVELASGSLSAEDFEAGNFRHFYNKNTDVLTLKSANSAIDNINVFNLLGQKVLNNNLPQAAKRVDLSTLKDGVYIVQVEINNTTKSIKFIKH